MTNLLETREVGRAIFAESADALFLFDPETDQVLDVNPAAQRLSGFSQQDLMKQPATFWVRFSGGDGRGMQRLRQAANKSGVFFSQDGFYLRTAQDGVWIPVHLTIARLHVKPKTLALMTARDIREQREAKSQLHLKEAELDRFFTLSLDMLCIAGFDGYFKRLNPAWEKTLGWSNEDLVAKPYLDFIHPEDREATIAEAQKLAGGDYHTVSFENRYRCLDGSYKWMLWNAAPLKSNQLIYAAARDITSRKEAEKQLSLAYSQAQEIAGNLEQAVESERKAYKELKRTQSRLVQSERLIALGQMVAGVAHEINNPLTFLTNNFVVLERDVLALRDLLAKYQEADSCLSTQQPELFRALTEQSASVDLPYILGNLDGIFNRSREGLKRIQQIVKDLRNFARLDEGDLHEINLNTGIESTINMVRGHASKKKVELLVESGSLPLVTCYPAKINQVVLNLLINAVDACAENGKVTVRTRSAAHGVEIHVIDNGSGIPAAIIDRIFDPFFTTKPPGKGTGLGLSISHGIVEDHGGTIEVESTPGEGTHFTVMLPLRPPPRAEP
jgi:PAS domain S-box-containing protein